MTYSKALPTFLPGDLISVSYKELKNDETHTIEIRRIFFLKKTKGFRWSNGDRFILSDGFCDFLEYYVSSDGVETTEICNEPLCLYPEFDILFADGRREHVRYCP